VSRLLCRRSCLTQDLSLSTQSLQLAVRLCVQRVVNCTSTSTSYCVRHRAFHRPQSLTLLPRSAAVAAETGDVDSRPCRSHTAVVGRAAGTMNATKWASERAAHLSRTAPCTARRTLRPLFHAADRHKHHTQRNSALHKIDRSYISTSAASLICLHPTQNNRCEYFRHLFWAVDRCSSLLSLARIHLQL